jgi:mannan endo-1,4-beta-mannosidase
MDSTKNTLITLFKLLAILVFFFLIANAIASMLNKKDTKGFVVADGNALYLNGEVYRSIGANRYNLLTHNKPYGDRVGCASPFSESEIDRSFAQMQRMGITTVRFWLFQDFTKSGDDLSRLDYVIATAEKYNIKLIPVFENHWHDCTEGGVKSSNWYTNGYKAPYGEYPLNLKDYISKVVPRYKDKSTILAWEIMNEANTKDADALYSFAQDVSQHVKSLDSKHLVSVGVSGTRESAADYKRLSEINTVDILDYHDYDSERIAVPDTLQSALTTSKESNKPLVIGESGIKKDVQNRPQLFEAKMKAYYANGGSIYMIWSYGDSYITNDGFNFGIDDPLAEVVKRTSDSIK